MADWIVLAVVAIPLVIAAMERAAALVFLANVYKRGGVKDLELAASATRHLAPRPGGASDVAIGSTLAVTNDNISPRVGHGRDAGS